MLIRNRQIGWSNKCNMLYDILDELKNVSAALGSSTTTIPPTSCYTYVLINDYDNNPSTYDYTDCDGNFVPSVVLNSHSSIILCARDIVPHGNTQVYNVGGDPCTSTCTLYEISNTSLFGADYSYTDCNGNSVGPISIANLETDIICAINNSVIEEFGVININPLNLCKCISYTLAELSSVDSATYNYIGCDLVYYRDQVLSPGDTVDICSLIVPTYNGTITITPNNICVL